MIQFDKLNGSAAIVCLTLLGCKPREFNDSAIQNTNQTQQSTVNFCAAVTGQRNLWNAAQVQQEISSLINEPGYKTSGLSAYAEVYLAMTRARDAARCNPKDKMYPPTDLTRRLNDALADLMTKSFVSGQRACLKSFANPATVVGTTGLQMCELSSEALQKKWSTLELAMGSTAVYLTSIMGLSLSALPHADILWINTPYETLPQRIAFMNNEFKPVYDSFNSFLSNNLHTVADVLMREKRIDCGLFKTAAQAVEVTHAPQILFEKMRSRTFRLGLELASSWPRGLHPLTAGEVAWTADRPFGTFAKEPTALGALREHARESVVFLKNPLMKIFKGKDAATYVSGQGLTCPLPARP